MEQKAQLLAVEAIQALSRLDVSSARSSIAEAFGVDHKIGPLADVVYLACAEIEDSNKVSTSTWNMLADAVDSAELLTAVESSRT